MRQKGHEIDQKGLKKKYEKGHLQDLKYLLFSGIFISGIGGYPPLPLSRKSSCPKTLRGKGGYPCPPPLTGKKSAKYFLTGSLSKI